MIEAVLLVIIYLLLFALIVGNYYSICLNYIYNIFKQIDIKKNTSANLPVSMCFFIHNWQTTFVAFIFYFHYTHLFNFCQILLYKNRLRGKYEYR